MRALAPCLVFGLALLIGCSAARAARDAGELSGDDGGPGHDAGASTPDAGGSTLATCRPRCDTADTCTTMTSGAYSVDHYTCESNECVYHGCNDDTECMQTYAATGGTWRCDTSASVPTCYPVCGSASDCTTMTNGAYSVDHYTCDAGHCTYHGCGSDTECAQTYAATGGTWACDTRSSVPTCYPVCGSASDCTAMTSGAYSVEHYTCESGHCVYHGCRSADECMVTYAATGGTWLCR